MSPSNESEDWMIGGIQLEQLDPDGVNWVVDPDVWRHAHLIYEPHHLAPDEFVLSGRAVGGGAIDAECVSCSAPRHFNNGESRALSSQGFLPGVSKITSPWAHLKTRYARFCSFLNANAKRPPATSRGTVTLDPSVSGPSTESPVTLRHSSVATWRSA